MLFSPKSSQNTSHNSPVRARYGVYISGSNCDLYSTSITATTYTISCYIGSSYNSTLLYLSQWKLFNVNWTLGNKSQWNSVQNWNIFFQRKCIWNIHRKLIAISFRAPWVSPTWSSLVPNIPCFDFTPVSVALHVFLHWPWGQQMLSSKFKWSADTFKIESAPGLYSVIGQS